LLRTWHAPDFVVDLVSTGELSHAGLTSEIVPGDVCRVLRGPEILLTGKRSVLDAEIVYVNEQPYADASARAYSAITLPTLHGRLGHPAMRTTEAIVANNLLDGVTIKGPVKLEGPDIACEPCILGKAHKLPFEVGHERGEFPGALLVVDLHGPMPADIYGHRYGLTIRDDFTAAGFAFLLKTKGQAEAKIREFVTEWERRHPARTFRLMILRSDLGGEFVSKSFEAWLKQRGSRHQYAARQTPQQNSIAERGIRTDSEATRTNLAAALALLSLPMNLWGWAYLSAVYTGNFVPRAGAGGLPPFQLWNGGSRVDASHLRVWGCECYPYVVKDDRRKHKFLAAATRSIFVGYGQLDGFKAWYYYTPQTQTVGLSRHVVFREEPIVQLYRRSRYDEQTPPVETPPERHPAPDVGAPVQVEVTPTPSSAALPPPEAEVQAPTVVPVEEPDEPPSPELAAVQDDLLPPASPPPVEPPIPADDNIHLETPPPTLDLEIPLQSSPRESAPPPRPPTPGPSRPRPAVSAPTPPERSPSPDPLRIRPGKDEVKRGQSYYRTRPREQPPAPPAPS
jgi:hypothetical protein